MKGEKSMCRGREYNYQKNNGGPLSNSADMDTNFFIIVYNCYFNHDAMFIEKVSFEKLI